MDLRYFLKTMLLPPFAQILILLFAWKIRNNAKRLSTTLFLIAVMSLWFLGSPVVSTYLAGTLEQHQPLNKNTLKDIKADAIVILSASQNEYAPEFGEAVSDSHQLIRVRYGAFLQRATGLPVLLSGGSVRGDEQRSLAATMAYDLVTGYGGTADWLESRSRTTAENARYSFEILSAENKTRILLVTSANHMMRSQWSFEQAGFTVLPAPTDFLDRDELTINSFIPSSGALETSSQVIHEWLGYWVYFLLQQGSR